MFGCCYLLRFEGISLIPTLINFLGLIELCPNPC
jgi:hypothetical protein